MALIGLYVGARVVKHVAKTQYENWEKWSEGNNVEAWVDEQRRLPTHMRSKRFDAYYGDATLQEVLAMLVDGVYSRDRAAVNFSRFVKPVVETFYEVHVLTEHYTKIHWTRMQQCHEEEEKKLGLKHYLRTDLHPNPVAPRLVIALRGTKLSSFQDLVDDVKIAHHTLHDSDRFQAIERLIKTIISTFREKYDGKVGEICITGHSLGAAMALLIGRNLATQSNERYSVHCFNPPFLTILQLIKIGFLFGRARVNNVSKFNLLQGAVEFVTDIAKEALEQIVADPHTMVQEYRHFASLVEWMPVLYVNSHDIICREYERYYIRKHKKSVNPISSQALVSILVGRDAKYSSLVPSVKMHVSRREKGPHDLKQWYTDPELVVDVQEYQLMGRKPPIWAVNYNIRFKLDEKDCISHSDSEDD